MPQINKEGYTAEERKRYGAAYKRLLGLILLSTAPDAAGFRRALEAELAAGLPIDWSDDYGWTLLHYAVNMKERIKAGLPQILIEAGADINVQNDGGSTPFDRACLNYVDYGQPEYLTLIDVLLAKGARPELDEHWKMPDWTKPDQRTRRDRLEAYIASWPERHAKDRVRDAEPKFDYAL